MKFEDKAEIVINQLRADRDRLQNIVNNHIEELENIKREIQEAAKKTYKFPYEYAKGLGITDRIIDNHISKLKGENKLTCERNICLNNEYNNIGCEDCVVTKGEIE